MVNCAMPISDCSVGQHWLNACLMVAREMSDGWYCAWKKRAPPVVSGAESSRRVIMLGPGSSLWAAS